MNMLGIGDNMDFYLDIGFGILFILIILGGNIFMYQKNEGKDWMK